HHCATFTGRHSETPGMMLLNRSVVGSASNCVSKVFFTGINRMLPLPIAHVKERISDDNKRSAHPHPPASYFPNKHRHRAPPRQSMRSCLLSHTPPLVEPDSNEVDMEHGPALVLSDEAPAGTSPASKARDTTRIATTLAALGHSSTCSGKAGR